MYKILPVTPLFTVASLGLIMLVWQESAYLEFFNAPWVSVFGLCCMVVSGLIAIFRWKSIPLFYDLFALGTFCVWFVHWREVYRTDAPVFAWYPMFFVLLTVLLNGQVVHKSHLMDPSQQQMIRLIHSSMLFHPLVLTAGILLSVYFSEYYLFYPIAVSLFLIRCSFGIALGELTIRE